MADPTVSRPGDPQRLPWWNRAPLALLVATAFLLGCFELSDFDIWYHLRAGELIPSLGVPEKDWFTFRSEDEEWIDVHWGFQRVVAEIYGRWGSAGLVAMKAALAAAAMTIALAAYPRSAPTTVQVLVWTPALLLLSSRFFERPEMFTLVFTAIFLLVLYNAERRPAWLWLLPLVQAAWANVQGLFVFGPILLAMYWAEAVLRVDRLHGVFRHLMPTTLLTFAACVASPYGFRNLLLVAQISQTATTGVYKQSIAELRSLKTVLEEGGAMDVYVWLFGVVALLGVLSVAAAWRTIWRERRLFRVLAIVAFGFVGMQAVRNGSHFALVVGTAACWNFGSVAWRRRPAWRGFLLHGLWLGAFLYAVGSERWHLFASPPRVLGFGERQNYYARAACELAGKPDMPRRALVMHNGHAALYEYLNFAPTSPRKTFADARLEVHSLQTYKLYLDLCQSFKETGGAWDALLKADGVDLVIADGDQYSQAQATLFLQSDWRCLHYDEVAAVFLRRTAPLPRGAREWNVHEELFRRPQPPADRPESIRIPTWIWRPPAEMRRGFDDYLAVRAGFVWDKLYQNKNASPEKVRAWGMLALQAAVRAANRRPWAVDGHRAIGYVALGSLQKKLEFDGAADLVDLLPTAVAVQALQRAATIAPNDFYANFWLAQAYRTLGATDLEVGTLERLRHFTPRDRQQMAALADGGRVATMLSEARLQLDEAAKRPATDDAALSAGRFVAALSRRDLPPPVRGDLQTVLGSPNAARTAYDAAEKSRTWKRLRSGVANAADGKWLTASEDFRAAADDPETAAEAHWALAWLAIVAGDRAGLDANVRAGLDSKPNVVVENRLKQLQELAPTSD
jgi:hypothetical protein